MPNMYFFAAFLIGIAMAGYLLGYQTDFNSYANSFNGTINSTSTGATGIFNMITSNMVLFQGILAFGAVVTIGALLFGNLAAIIPFALAAVLIQIFVIPMSYLNYYPAEIAAFIRVFFGLSIFVVLISFLRS